jgi:hypothetical protein
MRVGRIVNQVLGGRVPDVHLARWKAVLVVIEGIVSAGRLTMAAIGRALPGRTDPKHAIKRVDRLLANGHLLCERWTFFSALAAWLLGDFRRPVILIDWTKAADGFHALVAATPIGGRAMPLYEEIHPERRLGNHSVQVRFLKALGTILPTDCQPIIVTDAGFHGPFFRAVAKLGWDFVGRVRGTAKLRFPSGGRPVTKAYLYSQATTTPQDLGPCQLYSSAKTITARMILVRGKRKPGRRPRDITPTEAAKRDSGRDPWLLATSLPDVSAAAVVATYALRMKIEETFRDAKNHRFGWSLHHVRTDSADRLTVLLLLASIAIVAVTLLGFEAERRRVHRRYQANTVKRRVLSHFVLGLAVLHRRQAAALLASDKLRRASTAFRQSLRSLALAAHAA